MKKIVVSILALGCSVYMNGQTENTISISQDGVANETDINQEGTNNTLEVVQTGNQNELLIDQQGNSNTIFQSQTGNSNIAEATQLETLFNGNIEQVQEGFNNEMSAKQDIDFTFVSVRNTIIQSQNGGFNSAIADQNRISRFLDVNGTENIIEQSQQGIFNAANASQRGVNGTIYQDQTGFGNIAEADQFIQESSALTIRQVQVGSGNNASAEMSSSTERGGEILQFQEGILNQVSAISSASSTITQNQSGLSNLAEASAREGSVLINQDQIGITNVANAVVGGNGRETAVDVAQTQTGENNNASTSVVIFSGRTDVIQIQEGRDNIALVTSRDARSVTQEQRGVGNTATVNTSGLLESFNRVISTQYGVSNTINQTQIGDVFDSGEDNRLEAYQGTNNLESESNILSQTQSGNLNSAISFQDGTLNNLETLQEGSLNSLTTTQNGNGNNLNILQNGENLSISIIQNGNGNSSFISQ